MREKSPPPSENQKIKILDRKADFLDQASDFNLNEILAKRSNATPAIDWFQRYRMRDTIIDAKSPLSVRMD